MIELHYDLRRLPLGRFRFHRWRWELWHGERLCAAGWRTSPAHAEDAVRTYAKRVTMRQQAASFSLTPLPARSAA